MQRRGGSEQPVKGQSANRPKARKAPTAQVSTADLQEQLDRAKRERNEALEQQAATSEVLQVISSSPGKLEPVFNAMLANAVRICEAKFGVLQLCEGDGFRAVALHDVPSAYAERRRDLVLRPGPEHPLGRVIRTKHTIHVADILAEPEVARGGLAELAGARTILNVPMLKENELIGVISIYRQEVRPFTDKQIELVENFAAQAVIAIENTRLLNELRESLQQQTATADVLKVISSSPGELAPVFEAMLENAVRICAAEFGSLVLFEGNTYRRVALHNAPAVFVEAQAREPVRPLAASPTLSRLAETRQTISYADILAEQPEEAIGRLGGARTVLAVPMLKDDRAVGAISIYRQEVRPFTDKQMEVLRNFAAQAVIAIENTRLLNELRQRTNDLSESLEQQTATSEVLKVISSSPGELKPVFDALLANAVRICDAKFGVLFLSEGDAFRYVALHGAPPAFAEARRREPVTRVKPGTTIGRVAATKKPAQTADIRAEPAYTSDPERIPILELAGARTILGVPMLKESQLVGAIVIYRQEVRPFIDKQIELLSNFAAQAVIAVENTRLLNELRESLQQQTATANVLKVISRSTFNLQAVLDTLLKSASRLCSADKGGIMMREGDEYRFQANYGFTPDAVQYSLEHPLKASSGSATGRVALEGRAIHIPDVLADPEYQATGYQQAFGYRTILGVPLLREGSPIGVFVLTRDEAKPFTDKQIELVTTFADQAVIAIENVRLFDEVQRRTRELSESLEQQTATSEVLKVISSSPGELEPVFETMLANATKLCEASYGTLWLQEGDGFRTVAMHGGLPPAWVEQWRSGTLYRPLPNRPMARAVESRQPFQIADLRTDPSYLEGDPLPVAAVEIAGIRTLLVVPMFSERELVGAIAIYRKEVRPFSDKQIELVTNFAAQAVIAIENTRLLSELRRRTDDLSEALEQQTATSEVLRVISSSGGELEPVFQTMLANATRICEAAFGSMLLSEGELFRRVAIHNPPPMFAEFHKNTPIIDPRKIPDLNLVVETKRPVHLLDAAAVTLDNPIVKYAGARSLLVVPLLKDGDLLGAIAIYRQEVRPFTNKQIELVTNFAAQAVIAIENTRLLSELRESLQQQTATADVLKVISRSTFDLRTVLQTLVEFSGPALRCRQNYYHPPEKWDLLPRRSIRLFSRIHGLCQKYSDPARTRLCVRTCAARRACGAYPRRKA